MTNPVAHAKDKIYSKITSNRLRNWPISGILMVWLMKLLRQEDDHKNLKI